MAGRRFRRRGPIRGGRVIDKGGLKVSQPKSTATAADRPVPEHATSDPPSRPVAPPVKFDAIPAELREMARWVAWRYQWKPKEGKWTKTPVNPHNGKNASSTNPTTWGRIDQAIARSRFPAIDGIGFVLGDGYVGIDLDHCISETGEVSELARETVEQFGTYTEVSPSGRGLKLIFHASLTAFPNGKPGTTRKEFGIEAYTAERYFTVTGRPYAGNGIANCDDALNWFVAKHLTKSKYKAARNGDARSTPSNLDDQRIIDVMLRAKNADKIRKLWNGDATDYPHADGTPDYSRADSALCWHIAWYTKDRAQIERIFSRSELGKRDKWKDRADYRAWTIDGAIAGVTGQYSPGPRIRFPQPSTNGDGEAHESPPQTPNPTPDAPPNAGGQTGAQIILQYLRALYVPVFRRGNCIVCEDGAEVPMGVVCAVPNSRLIARLAFAVDAPKANGNVKTGSLPAFFKTWAKVSWGDLLSSLPEEDDAELGDNAPAREEFRRLVREAMLTGVVLGTRVKGKVEDVTDTERQSLADWCNRFARAGPWRSIRSYRCWCKRKPVPNAVDGEIGDLMIAIRHEVFSQLRTDRRLSEMGPKKFARRAARYGVGTTTREERPHGQSAVVLDDCFVADLVAELPAEEAETENTA
jgi:hypothetical protein